MAMMLGSAGRGGRRSRRAPMAEINVTPFVDVMLVLLIIFMVTAPLLTAGVPIELPDSRASALPQDSEEVTISIRPDGTIYLDDDALAPGELPARIAPICAGEDPNVTLRGDRALDYGRIMAVMGELNRAGCSAISLVTNATARPLAVISGSPDTP